MIKMPFNFHVNMDSFIPATAEEKAKAKQDYYRPCHNDDGDEYAMFTILEFNLFGCPILYMQPKLSEDYQPILLGHPVEEGQHAIKYQPKKMVPAITLMYDDLKNKEVNWHKVLN